jgi:hypothetical protein
MSKVKTLPSYTGGTVIFAYWVLLFFIIDIMIFLYLSLIGLRTIGYSFFHRGSGVS